MSKEEFIIKVKELGLVLTDKELHSFDRYYQILKEENSKYNLTRIIEEEEVYLKQKTPGAFWWRNTPDVQ